MQTFTTFLLALWCCFSFVDSATSPSPSELPKHSKHLQTDLLSQLTSYEVGIIESDYFALLNEVNPESLSTLNDMADITVTHSSAPFSMFSSSSPLSTPNPSSSERISLPTLHSYPMKAPFRFQAFNREFEGELRKNTKLFSPDYYEESQVYRNGQHVRSDPRNKRRGLDASMQCHYTGNIADSESSKVALSLCWGGFRGVIQADGVDYMVEPAALHMAPDVLRHHMATLSTRSVFSTSGEARDVREFDMHILYRHEDLIKNGGFPCGNKDVPPSYQVPHSIGGGDMHDILHSASKTASTIQQQSAGGKRGGGGVAGGDKFQVQTLQLVEYFVVNDHLRVNLVPDNTEQAAALIANIVANLYAGTAFTPQANVVLVGQITWLDGDPYTMTLGTCSNCASGEVSVDTLLSNFNSWTVSPTANVPHHDCHQLYSGYDFESSAVGYAGVSAMCSGGDSGGITQMTYTSIPNFMASIAAHEMGHNFGMYHDSSGNACAQSGFIMNAVVDPGSPPNTFSSCSLQYYQGFVQSSSFASIDCLLDAPTHHWGDPVCGNGLIECDSVTGICEQCDCGRDNCTASSTGFDPCCNGTSCKLFTFAQCSNSDLCCKNCMPVNDTRVCRPSAGPCDFTESCDGITGVCPVDEFYGSGTTCTDTAYGDGLCYNGVCMSQRRVCRQVGGTNFNECPSSTQIDQNNGNFCNDLYCSDDGGDSCVSFGSSGSGVSQKVPDGVPCGTDTQCLVNQCVASFYLNQNFIWTTGNWSQCDYCEEPLTRNVSCSQIFTGRRLVVVNDALCTPSAQPPTDELCADPDLGCVLACGTDVDLFGYCMSQLILMFCCLGGLSLLILVLVCCFQAVTRGVDEDDDDDGNYKKMNKKKSKRAAKKQQQHQQEWYGPVDAEGFPIVDAEGFPVRG